MDAIQYPVIEADGRKLVVKPSLAYEISVARLGIDPSKISDYVGPEKPRSAENWLKIFAAMVALNYAGGNPWDVDLTKAPSPDYWAIAMDGRFPEIVEVCNAAWLKATEAQKSKLALVPPNAQAS